jgi:hypothetical protein
MQMVKSAIGTIFDSFDKIEKMLPQALKDLVGPC